MEQQKACVCLGTYGFQRQLTLLTGTNTRCWWILGFIAVLIQNAHALKKHDLCSATSSSSWIRILPLQSMLVTFRRNFLSWRLQKDQDENCGWFIMSRFSHSEVNTESISPWSSVACISFPPATEPSQNSGLLTCSVQTTTMTACKYRKETASWILTETD